MEFDKYVRRPFVVEAVKITEENLIEIARLIGRVHSNKSGVYISVNPRVIPNITQAYVGWYVTRLGKQYRCYSPKLFRAEFVDYEDIIPFDFTNTDEDDVEEETDPTPPHEIERPDEFVEATPELIAQAVRETFEEIEAG